MKKIIGISLVVILCMGAIVAAMMFLTQEAERTSEIFVHQVELPDDFILGVDISSVISLEESGVVFRDFDGREADVFTLFAHGGANYIRVRVWNDPWYNDNGTLRGFGGGNNDVARAIEIGRRATAAGMPLLVNFHYSDFWADPGKQMAPRAWEGKSVEEKAQALYTFTYDTIMSMLEAGINIGMVQIGNETNNGMAGVVGWSNKIHLFSAGSRAVIDAERDFRALHGGDSGRNEENREILIAVHKTDPLDRGQFIQAAQLLANAGVVYDVFGISYYPFWHGSLDNLVMLMNTLSRNFNIDVAVFETSYPFTYIDTDGHANSWSGYGEVVNYPISVQGQAHAIRDVVEAVASVANGRGIGVFLWEPAWLTVGEADANANRPIWEQYGSGWASSWAAIYDPYDAGVYWGGSSWDNQAFFDHTGMPLPTLNLFNYIRTGTVSRYGNAVELVQQTESTMYFSEDLDIYALPSYVPIVMLDNSRITKPVIWSGNEFETGLTQFRQNGGVTRVYISGRAIGDGHSYPALHVLTILPAGNLVQNHSFEDPNMEMWNITFRGEASGYANRGTDNVLTGDFGFRWWRAADEPMDFSIEQIFEGLDEGYYAFELFITGGDAGSDPEIYIYVLINGEEVGRYYTALPGWGNWNNPSITNIFVQDEDIVTIGASLTFPNTAGAWGTIDDVFFFLID